VEYESACGLKFCTPLGDGSATPPNPPIPGLVLAGAGLTVATVIVETGLVWAEIEFAPLAASQPVIGVPLELTLVASSMFVLDVEIAYWSYVYRVYVNPQEPQCVILVPPWGFDR
jgi:hypothetical protein